VSFNATDGATIDNRGADMNIDGKPVVNAKSQLTISITERDVEKGSKKDPGGCAAALAAIRDTKCTKARVHLDRTYLLIGENWVRFRTPSSLRNEIIAFDRGGQFMPGNHELKKLRSTRVTTGKRQGGPSNNQRPRKSRKFARKVRRIEGVRERGANR